MTFIRMLRPAVLMFLICLCGAVVPLHAQNTVNLNGRVTDNNGQPLAGAQIVARNQETNQQRGAITRSDGSGPCFRTSVSRSRPFSSSIT